MTSTRRIGAEEARDIGTKLGIDWTKVDLDEFRRGVAVELEHGTRDPETNVTGDDPVLTGKIAWAHLREFPDYYSRLDKMEAEADAYWPSDLHRWRGARGSWRSASVLRARFTTRSLRVLRASSCISRLPRSNGRAIHSRPTVTPSRR
jgi:hypothetical protein